MAMLTVTLGANQHVSGLGLTIARDLVRAHGGELTLDSRPGQGTIVRLQKEVGSV